MCKDVSNKKVSKAVIAPDKSCIQCGELFNRATWKSGKLEPLCNYKAKKTCSKECRIASITGRPKKTKPAQVFPKKNCISCDSALERKIQGSRMESLYHFNLRKTCSRECTNNAQIKVMTSKKCQQCSKSMKRKTLPSGRLETVKNFLIRKFCNSKCYGAFVKKDPVKVIVKPPVVVVEMVKKEPLPHDAQFENNLGIFKKVGGRLFRHDNDEWIYKPTMNDMKFSKEDYVKGKGL